MTLYFIETKNLPIFKQLQLEEALLRTSSDNFCVINQGSEKAIVMGISGKKEELVCKKKFAEHPIPIIKRFSGGGTVLVDESTLFVSFLFQRNKHPFEPFPKAIMEWSYDLYKDVFASELFSLRENDYVFGEKKFGGNAQYIKKDRWLHHTSFLWDYLEKNMEYLLHPKKTPAYRKERPHSEFLCKLSSYETSQEHVIEKIKSTLAKRYQVAFLDFEEAWQMTQKEHRKNTTLVFMDS